MKYLLDTDTFSEMVKGLNPRILKRMESLETGDAALSVVTRGEIAYGLQASSPKPSVRRRIDRLLEGIDTLPLDIEVAIHYGLRRAHLRRIGTPIGPNDLWIAAHALAAKLTLVSNNTSEFARVPKLKLENWVSS